VSFLEPEDWRVKLTLAGESIASLCKALKLLRHPSVIEAICGGELAGDFGDGEAGGWMRLVERFARAEADRASGF
jgi:bloom syndrome protein